MADKAQTDMGLDAEGRTKFVMGLTGVTREIVRTFSFRCPTCAYKRDTTASAKPATMAIVVRQVFELVQVGGWVKGWGVWELGSRHRAAEAGR